MDHDANIATWLALEPLGATFKWWRMRDDGNHPDDLKPLVSGGRGSSPAPSPRMRSADRGCGFGGENRPPQARVFLDSVHYGPHGLMDVQAWNCDYLVCSGYKNFRRIWAFCGASMRR